MNALAPILHENTAVILVIAPLKVDCLLKMQLVQPFFFFLATPPTQANSQLLELPYSNFVNYS